MRFVFWLMGSLENHERAHLLFLVTRQELLPLSVECGVDNFARTPARTCRRQCCALSVSSRFKNQTWGFKNSILTLLSFFIPILHLHIIPTLEFRSLGAIGYDYIPILHPDRITFSCWIGPVLLLGVSKARFSTHTKMVTPARMVLCSNKHSHRYYYLF